jgi:hypothetical protein
LIGSPPFDDLPPLIRGRTDYRMLVTAGRLVPASRLSASFGLTELIALEIDDDWR